MVKTKPSKKNLLITIHEDSNEEVKESGRQMGVYDLSPFIIKYDEKK